MEHRDIQSKDQEAILSSSDGFTAFRFGAIADNADIIINGYAFNREDDRIHVLNLNNPNKAVVFNAIE